jgi:hypothetical protein
MMMITALTDDIFSFVVLDPAAAPAPYVLHLSVRALAAQEALW